MPAITPAGSESAPRRVRADDDQRESQQQVGDPDPQHVARIAVAGGGVAGKHHVGQHDQHRQRGGNDHAVNDTRSDSTAEEPRHCPSSLHVRVHHTAYDVQPQPP
jgi:hypothetical protein